MSWGRFHRRRELEAPPCGAYHALPPRHERKGRPMAASAGYQWRRDRDGLGVWEHRGQVAVAGVGHSPVDRRWDGVSEGTRNLRRPRESGDPGPAPGMNRGQGRLRQLIPKITPLWIMALDQLQLPRTAPFLDTLFTEDRIGHGVVKLDKHQPMHSVISNKSADSIRTMLPSTARNITCDTGIKRTITLAGEDVDARTPVIHARSAPGSPLSRGRRSLFLLKSLPRE